MTLADMKEEIGISVADVQTLWDQLTPKVFETVREGMGLEGVLIQKHIID